MEKEIVEIVEAQTVPQIMKEAAIRAGTTAVVYVVAAQLVSTILTRAANRIEVRRTRTVQNTEK